MIYLETKSTNPYYNLAFEEWVLTNLTEDEYLILWQNDNTVVVGQNQNALAEINKEFCDEHHVNVVRRTTGGGTVYHDLGNLNYSFIKDRNAEAGVDMSEFTTVVVNALKKLGANASASGRNDILVDDKKVSGTAQRVVKAGGKERILYHGTLLYKSDPSMIAGALNADPLKFKSKATKSVKSRVGNICDSMPGVTLDEFWSLIKEGFCEGAVEATGLVDLDAVNKLKEEKYDTYEWNYGKSPVFDYHNKDKFDGGILEVYLSVKDGLISDISFYGDFLSLKNTVDIKEKLIGTEYDRESISKVLDEFTLTDYFGTITKDEIISLII